MLKETNKCLEESTTHKATFFGSDFLPTLIFIQNCSTSASTCGTAEAALLKAWTDPQVVAPLTTLQPNFKPQGLETKPEES